MENIEVVGEMGEKPTLTFASAVASPELQVEVLVEGDGPVVEPGDQIICNYLGQVWNGNVFDNSYGDLGVPQAGIRGGDTLVFVTDILGIK